MGYNVGNAIYRELEKFKNDKIEVALGKALPYYFLEVEAINAKTRKQALADIQEFLDKMNLIALTKSEYQSFLRLTDKHANLIFDLKDFPEKLQKEPKWQKILSETVHS